jgi:sialate O-acetylesterase
LPEHWNQGEWSESQYHEPWNQATALFNLKIAPLTTHAVRGFIWCQGESDAGFGKAGAEFYQKALTVLIGDWRKQWGNSKQSFILSQLAAYDDDGHMPAEQRSSWAFLREAQSDVGARISNTAAIPIHDVPVTWNTGDFGFKAPIHPLDKVHVGERMALAARAITYGERVDFQGPVFERMEMSGDRIVVHFRNATGLKYLTGSGLLGFAVCGADRKFMNATAQIVGDTVEVSNSRIKSPVALTYGFTSMNHCANLFNGAGLPAVPFRTDRIKSVFVDCCDCDD